MPYTFQNSEFLSLTLIPDFDSRTGIYIMQNTIVRGGGGKMTIRENKWE